MNQEDVVPIYNRVLLNHTKEWSLAFYSSMDGPEGHCAEWRPLPLLPREEAPASLWEDERYKGEKQAIPAEHPRPASPQLTRELPEMQEWAQLRPATPGSDLQNHYMLWLIIINICICSLSLFLIYISWKPCDFLSDKSNGRIFCYNKYCYITIVQKKMILLVHWRNECKLYMT